MILGTTYICVSDMAQSLLFYRKLLEKEPSHENSDRWVTFDCGGGCLSLYNRQYDKRLIEQSHSGHFNDAYLNNFNAQPSALCNNAVIFNFETDNLDAEYQRIKALEIGMVSEIMYVNVHHPYWYFNVQDPDGNIIEISGKWEKENETII